jgi:hypothetical protein
VAMILDVAGLIGLAGNQKTMAAGEIAGSAA